MRNDNSHEVKKAGYLVGDYHLFYLKGLPEGVIAPHFHDFHKLILLIDGQLGYGIEGTRYTLHPDDAVFVQAGTIHAPEFTDTRTYERLIIYLSTGFGRNDIFGEVPLLPFLPKSSGSSVQEYMPVHRLTGESLRIRSRLIREVSDPDEYSPVCQYALLLELFSEMNRTVRAEDIGTVLPLTADPVIRKSVAFITSHLSDENLCIDEIAGNIPVSRSYLMHQFRRQMGCTIGEYITEKRLYEAGRLLSEGINVTNACFQSGFKNYSAFYYAYRKKYGVSPGVHVRPAVLLKE